MILSFLALTQTDTAIETNKIEVIQNCYRSDTGDGVGISEQIVFFLE